MKVPIKASLAGGAAAAALTLAQTACADLTPRDLIGELERLSEMEGYEFRWEDVEETDAGVRLNGFLKTIEIGSSIHQASAEWIEFAHSGDSGVSIRIPDDVLLAGSLDGGDLNHVGNVELTGTTVVASRDTELMVETSADRMVHEGVLNSPAHGPFGAVRTEVEGLRATSTLGENLNGLVDMFVRIDAGSVGTSLQGVGAGDMISASMRNPAIEIATAGSDSNFLLEAEGAAFRWVSQESPTGGRRGVDITIGASTVLEYRGEDNSRSLLQVADFEADVTLEAGDQHPVVLKSGRFEVEVAKASGSDFIARVQANLFGFAFWETLLAGLNLQEVFEDPLASLDGVVAVQGPAHLFGEENAEVASGEAVDGPVRMDIDNLTFGFDGAVARIVGFMEFPDFSVPDPLDTATADLALELSGIGALVEKLRNADLLDLQQYLAVSVALGIGEEIEEDVLVFRIEQHGGEGLTINGLSIGSIL